MKRFVVFMSANLADVFCFFASENAPSEIRRFWGRKKITKSRRLKKRNIFFPSSAAWRVQINWSPDVLDVIFLDSNSPETSNASHLESSIFLAFFLPKKIFGTLENAFEIFRFYLEILGRNRPHQRRPWKRMKPPKECQISVLQVRFLAHQMPTFVATVLIVFLLLIN